MKMLNIFFVQFLWLSASLFSCYGRGGGDAAIGGFAGGMFGGLMSGAMTREPAHRSRGATVSIIREIDKLEDAVRSDLFSLDKRIKTLENSAEDTESELQKINDINSTTKKSLKKIEAQFEDKLIEIKEKIAELKAQIVNLESIIKDPQKKDPNKKATDSSDQK
jgi:chromosome segregation ATPase